MPAHDNTMDIVHMNKFFGRRLILGGVGLLAVAGLLGACSQDALKFSGIDITGADYGKDFALPDQHGQIRSLKDFKGQVVMVFFGYTQCPDVCPTALTEMAQIKASLGPEADKFQGLFVTVDPQRDRPEMLKAYMANFDATFLALVPSVAQLPELAKNFKIYFKKVDGPTPTSYTMDHTAGSYIYDTQGHLRLFTRMGTDPAQTTADIRLLLKAAR